MNIDKFEADNNIPKGEIVRVLREEYPKFSKVYLSAARHSKETGVDLTPNAKQTLYKCYGDDKKMQCNFAEIFYARGCSWQELIDAGVNRRTIDDMFSGKANPTVKTLAKICKVLKCTVEELYGI